VLKVERLAIAGLPNLSFEVAAGECLGIEGPSGAGKTRILRAIADLDAAGGYVYFEGAERSEMPAALWRRHVRYVSAEPAWWAETARQHLTHAGDTQRYERAAGALGLPTAILDTPLVMLSTGERLRLGLARALADEPKVVLLDEPTGALDPTSAALTEELIRFLLLSGRSIVLVSHDPAQLSRLAHKQLQLGAPSSRTRQGPPREPVSQPAQTPDPRLATLAQRFGRST
jgi:ABC-type iron transport system FetAB ATPase subunit